ncbi:biotin--[acetyl-CoA-carboxylase] ligase [Corynebacterium sp. A21]|uniref:biotin--[acetyl-CoA-carboxylase] ligase n=1 Tax=Corynebacterium sp. A21 TaxID=3457318 RepID=UPI003FD44A3C
MAFVDIQTLTDTLVANGPYTKLSFVDSTGSTNADLLDDIDAPEWSVRLADHQSLGRGRLGRAWSAPTGSQLICSLLIRPRDLAAVGTIPLAVGVALTDAIPQARLKWPNDLQIEGRKLCGILAEARFTPTPAIVIGFGINVSLTREQLPVPHATSLLLEGLDTDRTALAEQVLLAVHRRLRQWAEKDPQLMADYRRVSASIGQQVRVELPGNTNLYGEVTAVLEDGRLQVRSSEEGELHELSAGDVTHLRLHEDPR